MSCQKMWIAECDVCERTKNFDAELTVEQLGEALAAADWSTPAIGGTFCPECTRALAALKTMTATRR